MSEKKVVRRSVAVGLVIICVVVVAGLVGAFEYYHYTPIVSDKDNTIINLQNIINLNESRVLLSNYTAYEPISEKWENSLRYAGYLIVTVSPTVDTIVEVDYTFQSLHYSNQVDYGMNGTAIFPVLPSSLVSLSISKNAIVLLATANVTITYYY
ncbi:MAG: hypothetical protein ABSG57_13090 [Candidatus Bathyarchaeia archaeon]